MRQPAVAGSFYQDEKELLKKQIEKCFFSPIGIGKLPQYKKGERKIKGAVVPHAGYMYSGPVASHVYNAISEDGFPEIFIILGPNHTGYGSGIALTTETFSMPFGKVEIDTEITKKMFGTIIDNDINAHRYEHSIEVQLPFLQYINPNFKFIPICIGIQDYKTAKEIGEVIKNSIKNKDVIVIASTDFTHYESRTEAERKDKLAIDAILKLDAKLLYNRIKENNITMCGYGPVMAMLESIDGKKAKLLKYATSGDIEKMHDVVGYAGIIIE